MTPQAAGREVRSVQALRALAALFVVAFHATVLWRDRFDSQVVPWANGNAGVDLFFVISGFIMVVSSRRLRDLAHGWRRFLALRLVRVVPLYWLATLAKLAAIAAVPAMALHTRPDLANIDASFLFLPSRDAAGAVRPVIDVGWTLSFEMLFYLVFACALALRANALLLVGPVMAVLALVGLALPAHAPALATLADPIVLEFVFGLAVGRMVVAGGRPPLDTTLSTVLLAAGLAGLALAPVEGHWQRTLVWGIAAAMTLLGAIGVEPRLGSRIPRLAVWIGEASYSLYLVHGFVLPPLGVAVAKAGLHGEALVVAVAMVVSTVAALVVYRFVEAPITRALRGAVASQ